MRILLVEDDPGLGAAVRDHMRASGHLADWLTTLADAWAAAGTVGYDLILLDLALPDGAGLGFLARLRGAGQTVPVIILTARDQITDRIAGLNAGADDYLVKPFDLAELGARIGAVSRRHGGNAGPRTVIGGLTVDMAARRITGAQGDIALTQREWVIFEAFLNRPGQVIPKSTLEDQLYSFDAEVESNTIEVYVSRLRKKLGPGVIETQRGLGYRLSAP
ncbi:MAG: response regulator transcription factor [Pseudomonadota bacterium]